MPCLQRANSFSSRALSLTIHDSVQSAQPLRNTLERRDPIGMPVVSRDPRNLRRRRRESDFLPQAGGSNRQRPASSHPNCIANHRQTVANTQTGKPTVCAAWRTFRTAQASAAWLCWSRPGGTKATKLSPTAHDQDARLCPPTALEEPSVATRTL